MLAVTCWGCRKGWKAVESTTDREKPALHMLPAALLPLPGQRPEVNAMLCFASAAAIEARHTYGPQDGP